MRQAITSHNMDTADLSLPLSAAALLWAESNAATQYLYVLLAAAAASIENPDKRAAARGRMVLETFAQIDTNTLRELMQKNFSPHVARRRILTLFGLSDDIDDVA